jgi:hypothetical protein
VTALEKNYALVRNGELDAARVAAARMKRLGADRRLASDPRAQAELAEAKAAKPHARCPRCHSTNASVVEVAYFKAVTMQCFACGLGQTIDTDQDNWV